MANLDNDASDYSLPRRAGPTPSQRHAAVPRGQAEEQAPARAKDLFRTALKRSRQLYNYSKISEDAIRLLTIEPKDAPLQDERKMRVVLTEVPISQLHEKGSEYEALSYYWGTEDADSVIYVANGANEAHSSQPSGLMTMPEVVKSAQRASKMRDWQEFRIKPNLYEALVHLRHDHYPRRYWIDALCIWQENRKEKEHQVSMMDKIYSKAARVLIWLGSPNDRTCSAMRFIPKLMNLNEVLGYATDGSEKNVQAWTDFFYLMRRDWFSRRWVVQELALAQDAVMVCGKDEVHWIDFRDAVSLFARNIDRIQELFKHSRDHSKYYSAVDGFEGMGVSKLLKTINNIFRTSRSGEGFEPDPIQGLEYLVSTLFGFHSSDPRDTIHALRNIAREKSRAFGGRLRPPRPDYSKDLLVTYTDFVRWVEQSTGCIDIICRYWAQREKTKEDVNYPHLVTLPSWIQGNSPFESQGDFERRVNGDVFVGLPGKGSYDACHGVSASIRYGAYSDISQRHSPFERAMDRRRMTPSRPRGWKRQRDCSDSATDASTVKAPRLSRSDERDTAAQSTVGPFADNSDPDAAYDRSGVAEGGPVQEPQIFAPAAEQMTSGGRAEIAQLQAWRRTIQVQGLRIGVIDWATDPIPDGVIPMKVLETLGHEAHSKDWPPDKLWRTLVAERDDHGDNPPPWYLRACHNCLLNGTPNGHINTRELLRTEQPEIVKAYVKRVQAVTWNRVFFEASRRLPFDASPRSEDGNSISVPSVNVSRSGTPEMAARAQQHMPEALELPEGQLSRPSSAHDRSQQRGRKRTLTLEVPNPPRRNSSRLSPVNDVEKLHGLGPNKAIPGDVVCVLFGCSVPCILRPQSEDALGKFYTFVGEAYVYGLMDGEAVPLRKYEDNSLESDIFEIR